VRAHNARARDSSSSGLVSAGLRILSVVYLVSSARRVCSRKMIDARTIRRLLAVAIALVAVGLGMGELGITEASQLIDVLFRIAEQAT